MIHIGIDKTRADEQTFGLTVGDYDRMLCRKMQEQRIDTQSLIEDGMIDIEYTMRRIKHTPLTQSSSFSRIWPWSQSRKIENP
jgi:hypothetical protein